MFKKYTKIKQIGHEDNKDIFVFPEDTIYIEEKIDGANGRFYIKQDGKIVFGSRNMSLGKIEDVQGTWIKATKFLYEKLKDKDLTDYKGFIFYGEVMLKHTINYEWDKHPPFIGFDIYDTATETYLDYDKKIEVFNRLDIPIVKLVKKCKAKDITNLDDIEVPDSVYYNGKAEGIVFKNYKRRLFAKKVRLEFKEENLEVFGSSKKYAKTDTEAIVLGFCTNPRIEKAIYSLLDEGNKLEMKLMAKLHRMVYTDMMEECWEHLIYSNKVADFRAIRKKVTKRCLAVLQQMIVNNAIIANVK